MADKQGAASPKPGSLAARKGLDPSLMMRGFSPTKNRAPLPRPRSGSQSDDPNVLDDVQMQVDPAAVVAAAELQQQQSQHQPAQPVKRPPPPVPSTGVGAAEGDVSSPSMKRTAPNRVAPTPGLRTSGVAAVDTASRTSGAQAAVVAKATESPALPRKVQAAKEEAPTSSAKPTPPKLMPKPRSSSNAEVPLARGSGAATPGAAAAPASPAPPPRKLDMSNTVAGKLGSLLSGPPPTPPKPARSSGPLDGSSGEVVGPKLTHATRTRTSSRPTRRPPTLRGRAVTMHESATAPSPDLLLADVQSVAATPPAAVVEQQQQQLVQSPTQPAPSPVAAPEAAVASVAVASVAVAPVAEALAAHDGVPSIVVSPPIVATATFAAAAPRVRDGSTPAFTTMQRADTESRFTELLRQSRAMTAAIVPVEDDAALPPLPVGEVATEYASEEPVGESTSWSKFSAFLDTVTMADKEADETLAAKVASPAPQSKAGLLKSMSKLGKAVVNLKVLEDDSESNDQLYIWGQSEFTVNARPAVQKLQHLTGENIKQIASGRNHFVLVTESGKVFTFGLGKHGVLGHGDSINTAQPKLVDALSGSTIASACCGSNLSAVITSDSKLYLWGWMGLDQFAVMVRPTIPEGLRTTLVEHVALGDDFCVVGTDSGKVLAWGGNAEGQVGCASEEDCITTPTLVVGISGYALELAACGKSAVAVTSQGAVFYWGRNWSKENKPHRKAIRLAFPKRIKQAVVGSSHVLALAFDGLVYGIGRNDVGQLGNRTLEASLNAPVLIDLILAHGAGGGGGGGRAAAQQDSVKGSLSPLSNLTGGSLSESGFTSIRKASSDNATGHRTSAAITAPVYVKAIACGETHCVALTSQGTVMVWGKLGNTSLDTYPVPVGELSGVSISSVDCGASTVSTMVGLRSTDDLRFRSFSPPVVQAATLERLVEWLTREEDHPGEDFIYAFLLTYPTFCDAPRLIALLRQRYESALQHGNDILERRVIKVLIKWTQKRKDDFASSEQTRKLMEEFSLALGQENYAVILQNELRKKPRVLAEGIFEAPDMNVQVFSYSAVAVAEQIALYSHTLLCRIGSRELLMGGWGARDGASKCPGISAMIQRFNHLSSFVVSTIIRHPNKDVRNKVYAFWIDCHRHLWNLNSFDGAVCLMSAFDSVPVQKLLHAQLLEQKPSAQRQLHSFSALFLENRKGYRAAIQAVLNEGLPCVPYVGILLTDVTFMRDGNPDTLDNGRLINFYKRVMLANQIKTFELMQAKPYSALQRIASLYEYLAVARGYPTKMQDKMVAEICKGEGLPNTSGGGASVGGDGGVKGSHASLRADEMFAQRPVERNALRAEAACLPADRRAVWSAWITRFQAQGVAFRALWVESGAFQETVRSIMASPVAEPDQPAFELVLRTFLVPTVDHAALAKWLYASSAAEPDSALALRIATFLEHFLLLQQRKGHSSTNLSAADAGPLLALDATKAPTAELARAAEQEAAEVATWLSAAHTKATAGAATTSTESELELLSSAILQPAVPVDAMLQELQRELREAERLREQNRRQRDDEVSRLTDELDKLRSVEDEYLAKLRQVQQQIATREVEAHEYRRTSGLQLRDADVRVRILERGINEKRRMVDATTAAHAMFQAFCSAIPPSLQHAPSDPASSGTANNEVRDRSAALLASIASGTQVARADLLELRSLHASLSSNPRLQEKQAASFADLKRDYERFAMAAAQIMAQVAEHVDAAALQSWRSADAELRAMQLDTDGPRLAVEARPPQPAVAAPLPGAAASVVESLQRTSTAPPPTVADSPLGAIGGAASSVASAQPVASAAEAAKKRASPRKSRSSQRVEEVVSVVRAKYKHVAEEDNELRFDVGDTIDVFKIHKSGWAKGRLQSTGVVGVFPMNFVEDVPPPAVVAPDVAGGEGEGEEEEGGWDEAAGEEEEGWGEGEDACWEEGEEEEEGGWDGGEEEEAAAPAVVHVAPKKAPPPPPPK